MLRSCVTYVVALSLGSLPSTPRASQEGRVTIDSGDLAGQRLKSITSKSLPVDRRPVDVFEYLGVPYAKAEKFAAPTRNDPWHKVRNATEHGPDCWQGEGNGSDTDTSDCLRLNVFAPAGAKKVPVMLWIHGGGGTAGSGSGYDGSFLSSNENVVVVTINYRLGPFGWWVTHGTGPTGNWGLMDQQMAMKWVQTNIAAFGGDPDRVTIFGQSSGACFVLAHLVANGSGGLFHRAIVESGSVSSFYPHRDVAVEYYDLVAKGAGCRNASDLECLRKVHPSKLAPSQKSWNKSTSQTGYNAVDGHIMPGRPLDMIAQGKFHNVPVIMGSTSDDYLGSPLYTGIPNSFDFFIQRESGNDSAVALSEANRLYNEERYSVGRTRIQADWKRLQRLQRDAEYACQAQYLAEAFHNAGGQVYVYNIGMPDLFLDPIRGKDLGEFNEDYKGIRLDDIGGFHASCIPFVFRLWKPVPRWNISSWGGLQYLMPQDALTAMAALPSDVGKHFAVSRRMSGMWGHMAHEGKPGGGWEPYTPSSPRYMAFGHGNEPGKMIPQAHEADGGPEFGMPSLPVCKFWREQKGLGRFWQKPIPTQYSAERLREARKVATEKEKEPTPIFT